MALGNSGVRLQCLLPARQGLDWRSPEGFAGKTDKLMCQELPHSLTAAKPSITEAERGMDPELVRKTLMGRQIAVELLLKLQTDSEDSDDDIDSSSPYDTRLLVAFMDMLTTDEFVLKDISLRRVTREAREGLLLQCGFCPGPYAACLRAAMVPPPLTAQWCRHVSLTGTRSTVALPRNLCKWIAQLLYETFEEITGADYRDVREHINALFCI
ncbi:hypothetical protein UY3_01218 [Chelonia mydas]|uniref:Uncharacterized protein n=1 Tax=Chelonia mydas TaxID=8469 RepID=M7C047_CHEMY|nr:hypothetical protein UY3_01218 [Chelonia mydas]